MPNNKLFSLFDDKLRSRTELLAGPKQNLDSLGASVEASGTLIQKIQNFNKVKFKVDYSDFSNFVFFNSALDFFNIIGEKILNEYPYDGTREQIESFSEESDPYQKYVTSVWPKSQSYLNFNPVNGFAYVQLDDVGKENGISRTSLLSPNSSSFSVEFWCVPPPVLTGSTDSMFVFQKMSGSSDGFSIYFSGSRAHFTVSSASLSDTVSTQFIPGQQQYFCFSCDSSNQNPILSAFTGSSTVFPTLVSAVTGTTNCVYSPGQVRAFIGSGTLSGKKTVALTGSLDDLRFWKKSFVQNDLSASFNTKVYQQDKLYGLWSFNETGSLLPSNSNDRTLVKDYSGHKINGFIQNYYQQIRASGSLLPYDKDELVLSLNSPEVQAYISDQQLSGTLYDRENSNQIVRMLPEQFFQLEEYKGTEVLKNFLFVLGRYFDQLKVAIDQFAHVLKTDYGKFNQTPDALLQDVAKFLGWEFTGNFFDADAVQYFLGKQVLQGTQANQELDMKLYEIKNEFWKRTLINLMHLYKTKGTKESVDSLLRVYGVNRNFVRLKEFGYKKNAGIQSTRIHADKSVPTLAFGSGSVSTKVSSPNFTGSVYTIETRLRFPTQTSSGLQSSLTTGSIWFISSGSAVSSKLYFTKDIASNTTGSLIYSGSEGLLSLTNAPIFDNQWYNVTVIKDSLSSSLKIDVRMLDRDEISFSSTASLFTQISTSSLNQSFNLGTSGSIQSQMWAQEARVWTKILTDSELNDHTMNFQSFGTDFYSGFSNLKLHWRLNENSVADSSGSMTGQIFDFSGNSMSGSATGLLANKNNYKKFLNDFNYIAAPEYGWTEEKVRVVNATVVPQEQAFTDQPVIALEFNLVDALNEDISQVLSSLDSFNEIIGSPVNKYRASYSDLEALRTNYFKRLQGSINFRVFADLLEFFDRSFMTMIKRLIPARATFLGDEFVVESHMLERPKLQWNYRRRDPEFQPLGIIKVFIRS